MPMAICSIRDAPKRCRTNINPSTEEKDREAKGYRWNGKEGQMGRRKCYSNLLNY